MSRTMLETLRGLIGAVVGGALGYLGFRWLLNSGFYGPALPGLLLGAGCGALSRSRSVPRGVLCAAAGLALSIYADWLITVKNGERPTIVYYLTHMQDQPVTLLFLVLAAAGGYWFGKDPLLLGRSPARPPSPREERTT